MSAGTTTTGATRVSSLSNSVGFHLSVTQPNGYSLPSLLGSTQALPALEKRQTPSSKNDKTIIRQAIETDPEAKAKLGEINNADGVGDAPELVPEPDVRCHATVLPKNWSYWFFIGDGQKRYAPQTEASLPLVRSIYSRFQSRDDSAPTECRESCIPLCERGRSASQTRQTVDRAAARYASSQRAMNHTTWHKLSIHEKSGSQMHSHKQKHTQSGGTGTILEVSRPKSTSGSRRLTTRKRCAHERF